MKILRPIVERVELARVYAQIVVEARRLKRLADNPETTQRASLSMILRRLSGSGIGTRLNLNAIHSYEQFRELVPITEFEFYRDLIEADMASGTNQLAPDPAKLYVSTSGTTGKPKYIPVTEWGIQAAIRAQSIATRSYFKGLPGAFAGRILAITGTTAEGETAAGVPFGAMSGVVSASMPSLLAKRYILPSAILKLENYDERYLSIAGLALRESKLSLMATANPSTLNRLVDVILSETEKLLKFVESGKLGLLVAGSSAAYPPLPHRAAELRNIFAKNSSHLVSEIWPKLSGIVTWRSGNCGSALSKFVVHCSSRVRIAEMGYLASEFRGTIPIDCSQLGGLPPIADTFFEFVPEEQWNNGSRDTLLLHQLREGERYQIIVTTGDGLLRYWINDLVEVSGRYEDTPLIKFCQKGKGVTNLTGEKLYESQVLQAMAYTSAALSITEPFFVMLADEKQMHYHLFVEESPRSTRVSENMILEIFERKLQELNCEYESKRRSKRLGEIALRVVPLGLEERLRKDRMSKGQRESQLKISRVDTWNPELERIICA